MAKRTIEIGILIYEGAQKSAIWGLTDLFLFCQKVALSSIAYAEKLPKISHWKWEHKENRPLKVYDSSPADISQPAVMIIPPSLNEPDFSANADKYSIWLRQLQSGGCILASVCAGAFLLAETGLLNGRKVTTHWMYADTFSRRFPLAELDINSLIIDGGDIITAGGAFSWTDLGLRLIDRFFGAALMLDTAKMALIDPPGRQQSLYIMFTPKENHGDKQILNVQRWLSKNYSHEVLQTELATIAKLSPRTFLRRFKKATGYTPKEYFQRLRISHGRYLLETTRDPVDKIAWEVGYADHSAFRRLFLRYVGLAPGEYRNKFKI